MFRHLLPQTPVFFDFFEEHARLICQAASELLGWVSTGEVQSFSPAENIKGIERSADMVAHNCIEALHKTFITPIDREDIHRLISRMDDIIDEIEAAAAHIALYRLKTMTPAVIELAQVLQNPVQEVSKAVQFLRKLQGKEIRASCIKINYFENQMDELLKTSLALLFERTKDPIEIIKWKEIYENLEDASDRCEDVANILEGIVLEND